MGDQQKPSIVVPSGKKLEEGQKRISEGIKDADIDALFHRVMPLMTALLGASSVELFLKDSLTGEFYSRYIEKGRVRERRLPADTSSVVGTAAMTHSKAFGWERTTPGERYYLVADPMATEDEILGVVELVHGIPNEPVAENQLKIFYVLVRKVMKRLQVLLQKNVRATPYDYLVESGTVSAHVMKESRKRAAETGLSVEHILLHEQKVPKQALGKSLSRHFRCPFVTNPGHLPLNLEMIRKFPPDFLKTNMVLPVRWVRNKAEVVVVNPRNLMLRDDLARQLGTEDVSLIVAVREDILATLEEILQKIAPPPVPEPEPETQGEAEPQAKPATEIRKKKDAAVPMEKETRRMEVPSEWSVVEPAKSEIDLAEEVSAANDSAAVRVVNEILQAAINEGVSDIHFEPTRVGSLLVRFRVDGICHDHRSLAKGSARPVVSRIKIMSELDIAEHRLPQDGKIRLKDKSGRSVDLRVAVLPTYAGYEDVVLRLLPESDVIQLGELGFEPENLKRFRHIIKQPHGIILCVGPTGSGKTTTLHAALAERKGSDVKVWTAEDPVEITQEGVRQLQVNHKIGLTFERALRAFLRSDPDVIMIGEIRDRETAHAAIEASLTGHLVFSTLHTNSAPETVTRLLEMGLDSFTFGDSLLGVLAQRLVRTICRDCREVYAPKADELKELKRQYGGKEMFDQIGISDGKIQLVRGKGCSQCFDTGYKGRMGIHEILAVTPEIRHMIQQKAKSDALRKEAMANGMTELKQDGIRKILKGKTDLKEVLAHTMS